MDDLHVGASQMVCVGGAARVDQRMTEWCQTAPVHVGKVEPAMKGRKRKDAAADIAPPAAVVDELPRHRDNPAARGSLRVIVGPTITGRAVPAQPAADSSR